MHKVVKPEFVFGMALFAQVLAIPFLWGHQSTEGAFLGRYSLRYSLVLIEHIVVFIGLITTYVLYRRNWRWTNIRQQIFLLVLSAMPVLVLWFLPLEDQIKQYNSLIWLLFAFFISGRAPALQIPELRDLLGVGFVIIVLLALFTVLTEFPFSPDEAHWADYASTAILKNGIYARTWLMNPVTITPGLGWSIAAYGWGLEHVAFDIRFGRLWNFASYLLAFVGIGLLTARFYGRNAAFVSVTFAILSRAFIPIMEYRPDHQLAFASVWIVFAAVVARQHTRSPVAIAAHFICGLFATISLQLHAAGIAFAFGMALFYIAEWLLQWRRGTISYAPVYFGAGSLLGTVLYYFLNIVPVGGIEAYLSAIAGRTERLNTLQFATWPSLLEAVLLIGGLGFLLWRRNRSDRLYLCILFSIIIGLLLFDTQGYRTPVIALYSVGIGTLIVDGFNRFQAQSSLSSNAAFAFLCMIAIMSAQMLTWVNWSGFSQLIADGAPPNYVYHELKPILKPYLYEEDRIVSTHLLIWALPNQANLTSVAGEFTAKREWNVNGVEVWEQVDPTVIIDIPTQMSISDDLRIYMNDHHFQRCAEFAVQGLDIILYRVSCGEAA